MSKTKKVVRKLNDKELGFLSAYINSHVSETGDSDIAHAMKNAGFGLDYSMKELRNKIRYARKKMQDDGNERVRVNHLKNGDVIVNRHETASGNSEVPKFLDEELLEKMGLNPEKYVVSSYGESEWDAPTKNGIQVLHSKRTRFTKRDPRDIDVASMEASFYRHRLLDICNDDVKKANDFTKKFGEIEKVVESAYGTFYGKCPVVKNDDGDFSLILPLADLHIGEGDAEKMAKSYKATFTNKIIPYIKNFYFSGDKTNVRSIDFACLGDIIHCDNGSGTTTAGTQLNPRSSAYKAYNVAVDLLDWLISTFKTTFNVPIRFVYVYGNHDTNLGFGIVGTVQRMYRSVPGVEFIINEKLFGADAEDEDNWYTECELNPEYLWVKYGDVGITYTHGKFNKKNAKNIPEVANKNARKDVAYNAVIFGHLHHLDEAKVEVNQHNYGLSTPNFVRDKFGRQLGCVTDPEFYLFTVHHDINRLSYIPFPSLPYNKQ